MRKEIVLAQAPSNIALLKYMGKSDSSRNLPENASISMTLNHLCSFAEIRTLPDGRNEVQWVQQLPRSFLESSERPSSLQLPQLDPEGIQKVLRHLKRVQERVPAIFSQFNLELKSKLNEDSYELRTANTFPMASGIASSASSFAALTAACAAAFAEDFQKFMDLFQSDVEFQLALARLSREGSGSSCRSFVGPWVLWEGEKVEPITAPAMPPMAHFVLLIQSSRKEVSSSMAHRLVRTSPLWKERVERTAQRKLKMLSALERGDLYALSQLAWIEAWEMHSLFHTAEQPFTYWASGTPDSPSTVDGLKLLSTLINQGSPPTAPPIVTMDAGPNIHILVEREKKEYWRVKLQSLFADFPSLLFLEDEQGMGVKIRVNRGGEEEI